MTETVDIPHLTGDYALTMRSDAMSPEIKEGDLLVLQKTSDPEDGWVVAAKVRGEVTVRRYRRDGGTVHLLADNEVFERITAPAAEVVVMGRVTGLVRSLA